jgi:hypothetical protein
MDDQYARRARWAELEPETEEYLAMQPTFTEWVRARFEEERRREWEVAQYGRGIQEAHYTIRDTREAG